MSAEVDSRPLVVVIVDDCQEDRAEVRRLLMLGSERRYRFLEAETGAAAIAACQAGPDGRSDGPPDCVILDFSLPDMNGGEVLEALRAGGPLTICPVLVLTGNPAEGRGPAMLRAGAQDYLNKSWMNAESLYRSVENAIERHRMNREALQREAALQESQAQLALALSAARLTADALRTSQAQLAGITGSAMDAIVSIAEDGRVLFYNQAAETMFGVPAAEALGSPHERFLPQRYHATHAEQVRQFGQSGITARSMRSPGLLKALRASGEEFPVEATISHFLNGGQRVFTVILRDITQRVRSDEERASLLRSEQAARQDAQAAQLHLRQAIELLAAALDVPAMLDVAVQGALRALADGASVEVAEDPGPDQRHRRIRWHAAGGGDAHMAQQVSRLRERDPWSDPADERMQVLRSGQPRLLADVADPKLPALPGDRVAVLREAGVRSCLLVPLTVREQTLGVLSCFILDPGRRLFDERDVAAAQDLARAAALAIDHALLYQQAQGAIAQRDDVLGTVSHDLTNSAAKIQLRAQLLVRCLAAAGPRDESALSEGLAQIRATSRRMGRQLSAIVDVTRLQAGQRLVLHLHRCDLIALCREEITEAQALTEHHRIALVAARPTLYGKWDEARLSRVVGNLISNAIKYSPEGGDIVVQVSLVAGAAGAAWAKIEAQDGGIGIPAPDLPHVFERFHRASNVRQIHGTGLGLFASRQMVEQHGGTITATSAPGQGTRITVLLPDAEG